ncbi:MAG TPA: hypothetical protein VFY93_19305 [Planctomycetota bacterium]|nr:hypothetical protein [Planctomycetota bacterium]
MSDLIIRSVVALLVILVVVLLCERGISRRRGPSDGDTVHRNDAGTDEVA